MLNNIKNFFNQNLIPTLSDLSNGEPDKAGGHAAQLALAALLVEVAESDYRDAPEEHQMLLNIVKETFELPHDEANEIIDLARKEHENSTDYFQFTRLINENYSAEQKIQLVESLWRVAFSDHHLDKYEEHVIRRIADLLYVSHSDFMSSKLRIQSGINR